jgi:hypothetical protein
MFVSTEWKTIEEFPNYMLSENGDVKLKDKVILGLGYKRSLKNNKPLKKHKNGIVFLRKNCLATSASVPKLMKKYFPEKGVKL